MVNPNLALGLKENKITKVVSLYIKTNAVLVNSVKMVNSMGLFINEMRPCTALRCVVLHFQMQCWHLEY